LSTGRRFSAQRQSGWSPYRWLQVGFNRPRPELYARIDSRVDSMFAAGFIDEVRGLIEMGYSPELPTFSAIGYKEIVAYLQSRITLEEALMQIKRATRTFVRRQANWFKTNDAYIHWFMVDPNTADEVEAFIRVWSDGDKNHQNQLTSARNDSIL
jgi:tRNA dimethylallyltransferase